MKTSHHIVPFLDSARYAPNSRTSRIGVLRTFCERVGDPEPNAITSAACFTWWASIDHLSEWTARTYLWGVRRFMAYLVAIEALDRDPTRGIVMPAEPDCDPVTLTDDEVRIVWTGLRNSRDRAAVSLMLGAGLRVGDVSRVRIERLNLADSSLRVRVKGGKTQTKGLPAITVAHLTEYLTEYPATSGPLIRRLDRPAEQLAPHGLRTHITSELDRLGIKAYPGDGKATHVFRRTLTTQLIEGGAALTDVQQVLGHADLSSLKHYAARRPVRHLAEVLDSGPGRFAA